MNREEQILKFVDKSQLGIEVAPYFSPMLPKSKGFNVLILDIFDTDHLRALAAKDPLISDDWVSKIEPVDIVGDASSIGDAVAALGKSGQISYIVSSHNFEHLPNPIKFLQGCSAALKEGGILSLAVPDCRACFDHFRSPTILSNWLQAFHSNTSKPNTETLFDFESNQGAYMVGGSPAVGCDIKTGILANFVLGGDLQKSYDSYLARIQADYDYVDAHCTVMFPESLELLLRDCTYLGLIDLEIVEISQTNGLEFYVHLKKGKGPAKADAASHKLLRQDLLRKINLSLGAAPYLSRKISLFARYSRPLRQYLSQLNRKLRGRS